LFRQTSRQGGGVVFGFRGRDVAALDVRFCEECGEVTTAVQRAFRRVERDRARVAAARLWR